MMASVSGTVEARAGNIGDKVGRQDKSLRNRIFDTG